MNKKLFFVTLLAFCLIVPVFAYPIYDINQDGKIDMTDITLVGKAFGSTPESPRWDSRCDVVQDGHIDMNDLALVAKHFGE